MAFNGRRILASAAIAVAVTGGVSGCVLAPVFSAVMQSETDLPAATPERGMSDENQVPAQQVEPDGSVPSEKPTPTVSTPVFGPPEEQPRPTPTVTTRIQIPEG